MADQEKQLEAMNDGKNDKPYRNATEIAAMLCIYNIGRLACLYIKGIDPTMVWQPTIRPVLPRYLTH